MQATLATTRLTKRTLVAVSHAIERAALAAAEDGPLVVIALFQRPPYFERERAVYEKLAQVSAVTVVGVVAGERLAIPGGPAVVQLDDDDGLAREWTVVALTPRFGAILVARDLEEVAADAVTIESGRVFEGRWSYRRDDALHEVLRLREKLADRLEPAAAAAIDDVVERVRELTSAPGEARVDRSIRWLVNRLERDGAVIRALRQQVRAAARGADEPAGILTSADIQHWSGAGGVTASGTLTVALLAVQVTHDKPTMNPVGRLETRQAELSVSMLTSRMRPADRATHFGDGEFLLVMPALAYKDTVALAYRIRDDFAAESAGNSLLSATATVALAVTRQRPLPVEQVRQALRWAHGNGIPVATIDA